MALSDRKHSRMGRTCSLLWAAWLGLGSASSSALADLAGVVARVEPSVVVVVATRQLAPAQAEQPAQYDHVFGSGFFVSPTDIVTAAPVLDGAQSVRVVTRTDERYAAAVIGVDVLSRIALVRIAEPVGLPVEFVLDRDVAKGQSIFTLGSHLGMGITLAAGMINGTERTVTTSGLPSVNDAFEIDAPVSADGAGSPVLCDTGGAVGMVLFSLVPEHGAVLQPPDEGGSELTDSLLPGGLGRRDGQGSLAVTRAREAITSVVTFCLPADTVAYVAKQLRETGQVRRGRLGVEMSPTPAGTAAHLGIDGERSAMVVSTVEGGPAAAAGLRPYDIVVAMDGQPIRGVRHLVKALQMRPNERVSLTVRRGAQELATVVQVGEMLPDRGVEIQVASLQEKDAVPAWLGVRVVPVDPSVSEHAGIPSDAGAIVRHVFAGSPAEQAGVRPGDILLDVASAALGDLSAQDNPLLRLRHRVRSLAPADVVTLEISRLDAVEQRIQLHATLTELPEDQALPLTAPLYPATGIVF